MSLHVLTPAATSTARRRLAVTVTAHRWITTHPADPEPSPPPTRSVHNSRARDSLRFAARDLPDAAPDSNAPPPAAPSFSRSAEDAHDDDTTSLATLTPNLPPPPPLPMTTARVPFSTSKFVRRLESSGWERGAAEAIMSSARDLLTKSEGRAAGGLLGRGDLENSVYLHTAALSELKTSMSVKNRNDSLLLKSLTTSLQRDVEGTEQRLREGLQMLRSDIKLDMNNRREEVNEELKALDMNIMDLNSKFTILLGEARTEIEATKWISTRRVMSAIVVVVLAVLAWGSSSSSKTAPKPVPSIEELGVREGPSEADGVVPAAPVVPAGFVQEEGIETEKLGGGGWFFN